MNRLHSRAEINHEHPRINKRSELQQQYRDELAKALTATRKEKNAWENGAAYRMLKGAKQTDEYHFAEEGIKMTPTITELLKTSNDMPDSEFLKKLETMPDLNENLAKALIIGGK